MLIFVQVGRRALEGKLCGTIFTLDRIHIVLSKIEGELARLFPDHEIILSLLDHDDSRVGCYGLDDEKEELRAKNFAKAKAMAKSIEKLGIFNPSANPPPIPKLKLVAFPALAKDAIRELL